MEYVKQYALSICVAALVATLVHMLLPNSNISKVLKTAIGVFFLSAVISPFLMDFNILDEIERYTPITLDLGQEFVDETEEYVVKQFENKIKELILNDLNGIGIDPVQLKIDIYKENDGTVVVESVEVVLRQEDARYKTDVALKIKNITQCQPEIFLTEVG